MSFFDFLVVLFTGVGFPFLFLPPGFSHFPHDLSKSKVTFGVVKCVINKSFSCNDILNCKKDEGKKKLFFSSSIHGPEHSMHSGRFDPKYYQCYHFFLLFPIFSPVTKSPAAIKYKKNCIVHKFFTV